MKDEIFVVFFVRIYQIKEATTTDAMRNADNTETETITLLVAGRAEGSRSLWVNNTTVDVNPSCVDGMLVVETRSVLVDGRVVVELFSVNTQPGLLIRRRIVLPCEKS